MSRPEHDHDTQPTMTTPDADRDDLPELVTIVEVAAALRVSRATIYRLVHNGELPGVRVGKAMRVTRRAVSEFMRRPSRSIGP